MVNLVGNAKLAADLKRLLKDNLKALKDEGYNIENIRILRMVYREKGGLPVSIDIAPSEWHGGNGKD